MTTLSGRQTQIQILEYAAVVTNWTLLPSSTGTNLFQTQNVPIGPIVDITPDVSADGLSIGLRLVGTETKFFGYDDPGQLEPNAMAAFPLPHFRFRQLTASEEVPDGQTLLLMGLVDEADIKKLRAKVPVLVDIPVLDRLFRSESTASLKKHLLIFVTPTLIDPAGNRIHREHNDSPALK